MENLDWTLCRSFLEVMRHGSLAKAARQLGLTHPTIKRHIDAMELSLGAKLFARSPYGLAPTELALSLRPAAETMEAAFGQILRTASGAGDTISGTVRITASEVIGHQVLPAILAALKTKHPGLAIELHLSNVSEDLLRRDADIAVRMHAPRQNALVARRVGSVEIGIFAHKAWLKKHGVPKSAADLIKSGALIGYDQNTAMIDAFRTGGFKLDRKAFALRTNSDLAQLAALRAGFGPGMCQIQLATRDLQRILPNTKYPLEMWLVTHADLRAIPRIRAVMEFLADHLSRYVRTPKKGPLLRN